jgi:multidrug efflux pump subunit AcrB
MLFPEGYDYEWTEITYQQLKAGNMAPLIFCLSLVLMFLVMAAQYESWSMPFMVILGVPIGVMGAIASLLIRGMDLDVYGQIGLVMLIGLTAKNAILIVEFAANERKNGASILDAAINASLLRLRPILMTALAFVIGLIPLVIASGAGANARKSLGTVVVGGLLLATVLVNFIPVFYYVIENLREGTLFKSKKDQGEEIVLEGEQVKGESQ